MSTRKRPLAEISQPISTPARYVPSTPHAIRALQERQSTKRTRSARSVRRINDNNNNSFNIKPGDTVRPDGSARNILRQFARLTAPVTKKRISTPTHHHDDKENAQLHDDEDDSVLEKRPGLTFDIEESIEDGDSDLPIPPTPSILPDDTDEDDDDDVGDATITFQNIVKSREQRAMSENVRLRKSLHSVAGTEADNSDIDEHDGEATILTERGRRALSEDATGRLSRYSFGSIRFSDFGSELEIRRDSGRQGKPRQSDGESYVNFGYDDTFNLGDGTGVLDKTQASPTGQIDMDDSMQVPGMHDESFNLEVAADMQATRAFSSPPLNDDSLAEIHRETADNGSASPVTGRRQTLLESAVEKGHKVRKARLRQTRHGNMVPTLPSSLIKRVIGESYVQQGKRKPKLGRDHMKALEQATEWFFEQAGEDLAAYSTHAKRKKRVNEDDVFLLMSRQKVLGEDGELRSLAKKWLSKDILRELDLPDRP